MSGKKQKIHLVLGGPGTGKTTRLLDVLGDEMSKSVDSRRIAYVSFTKRAVREAKTRIQERFGLRDKECPYFRTIHSMCYRETGVRPAMVMSRKDLRKIGEVLGVPISGRANPDDDSILIGDRMLSLHDLSRVTFRPLEEVWHDSRPDDISWYRLLQFAETIERYKTDRGLVDFTDMLNRFSSERRSLDVDVAIIDEAQDLTPAQWLVVDIAFAKCDRIYFAGDDDQAIYSWSGADVRRFLTLNPDSCEILSTSHRLSQRVHEVSTKVLKRIEDRYEKDFKPLLRRGTVEKIFRLSDVDMSQGTWFLLSRNRCFLKYYEAECVRQGLPFTTKTQSSVNLEDVTAIRLYEFARSGGMLDHSQATRVARRLGARKEFEPGRTYDAVDITSVNDPPIWHDCFENLAPSLRAYYVAILRRGESMTRPPRIHVDTIHGVKGGEADNVVLMVDQTSKTFEESKKNSDDESRVFYVGMTRSRNNLWIMHPQTDRFFPLECEK